MRKRPNPVEVPPLLASMRIADVLPCQALPKTLDVSLQPFTSLISGLLAQIEQVEERLRTQGILPYTVASASAAIKQHLQLEKQRLLQLGQERERKALASVHTSTLDAYIKEGKGCPATLAACFACNSQVTSIVHIRIE